MVKKFLLIIIIIALFSTLYSNTMYAITADDVMAGAKDFVQNGEQEVRDKSSIKESELIETSNLTYNTLLAIAMVIAVTIGIGLGIKFMMASASDKAEIKQVLWAYAIGCIVIFGGISIWRLSIDILNSIK